jgi:MFS family permease
MDTKFHEKRATKRKFFYGHVIVGICFITLMIMYGALYSFGVFLKPIVAEFGWTRAVTAGAYSLYFLLSGLWSILAGRLSDRFEPRLIVTCCGLLVCLCYLLLSQITDVWQIYLLYGVLLSLGVATSFVAIYSTVARWFTTSRGLASGIVSAGIGVGVVVMPPLANLLINSYSWHTSFMVIGLIALIIPAVAQFLKREPGSLRNEMDEIGRAHV